MAYSGLLSVLLPLLPPDLAKEDYENLKAILTAIEQLRDTVDNYLDSAGGSDMLLSSVMSARFEAAETITAGMFVTLDSTGRAIKATYLSCLGVATTGGDVGQVIAVTFEGRVSFSNWSLVVGDRYYVGADGLPSNSVADRNYRAGGAGSIVVGVESKIESMYVGVAITSNSLLLAPKFLPFATGQ